MKHRIHREEMKRFADSEEGTAVWYRQKTVTNWRTILEPTWNEDYIYILDDEDAELRKKSADENRPIQVYDTIFSEWETPKHELEFNSDIKSYRLEPKEDKFKYPIYKLCIYKDHFYSGCVVEFTGETEGVIVKDTERTREFNHHIGYRLDNWIPHTDTNAWKDHDYIEPIAYYRWEQLIMNGSILTSSHITDKYAEKHNFENSGWRKIESSKRTWEY